MELTGEETLMDILPMFSELMIAGYEDVLAGYNLRIDNCPFNGDTKLIISQMKARDIAQIHVCDNAGVAKGVVGMNKVLDINMQMPDTLQGFVEGQGGFGSEMAGIATVNALYGSKSTDLYANASYRHQSGNSQYLTLHMTNRFNRSNRLLTYFTQQYLNVMSLASRKIMGRARYYHTFNDRVPSCSWSVRTNMPAIPSCPTSCQCISSNSTLHCSASSCPCWWVPRAISS